MNNPTGQEIARVRPDGRIVDTSEGGIEYKWDAISDPSADYVANLSEERSKRQGAVLRVRVSPGLRMRRVGVFCQCDETELDLAVQFLRDGRVLAEINYPVHPQQGPS